MSRVQEAEDTKNSDECNNTTDDEDEFGLGPEMTLRLSPKPGSELPPKVNVRSRRNTFRPIHNGMSGSNHRQALAQSQHTEIEFYSTESDADDEADNSFCDSDDNSSNTEENSRYAFLQRAASRQSFHSTASDAFTLPVGSQDDVSSLECDNPVNKNDHDSIDDISLEEAKLSNHDKSSKPPTAPVDVVDTFESPRRDRPSITDPARLQALRDSFAKKNHSSAAHMSFTGLDQLPATLEEEENDDDNSVKVHDLLSQLKLERSNHEDDAVPTTLRLHNSLFLPRDGSSFFLPFDLSSPTTSTPKSRQQPKSTSWSKSLSVDDISFDILAKTLPPELDLTEARKYIIQLSHGVMETPTNESADHGKPPPSATKSAGIESEYTEVIVEDDEDYEHRWPLSPPFFSTPQSKRTITSRINPRESTLSYDYSEIMEEEVIEDDLIEEEVIEDETEVIYEEELESDDSFAARLGAVAAMVNNSG